MHIIRRYVFIFFFLLLSIAFISSVQAQERIIVKYKDDTVTPESIRDTVQTIEKKQNGNVFEKMQAQFMIWQETQELGSNPLTLQAELNNAEKTARVKKQTEIFATKSKFRTAAQQAELSPIRLIEISDAKYLDTALETYNKLDTVEWAVYDAPVSLFTTPNDPKFSQQWPLYNSTDHDIDATDAWNITQGSAAVTLAEIDSGVDRNHPDLKDNIFVNTAEIPGNNIDDDGNGYVDDVYGWNFLQNNNDTFDTDSHGTHVAGIMAAKANNNLGVAGVSQSKILPLRIFTSGGVDEHTSDVLRALQYTADNAQRFNIKAVNMSFGATRGRTDENATDVCVAYEPVLKNLYSKGVTAVAAAGNGDANKPWEPNQGIPFYNLAPAGCYGVIAVGATDTSDNLASFSNYGPNMVLSAPGSSYPFIISTCPSTYGYEYAYCEKIGTSMAAPYVVGTLGLMYSVNPALNHWASRAIFSNPANYGPEDMIPNSSPTHYAGTGRLNSYKAVRAAQSAAITSEPATMTVRNQDITMSLPVSAYSAYPNIRVVVTDEGTGKSVNGAQVVLTLRTPDGQTKQFSGFTDTQDSQDQTKWYATFTAYLGTSTLNALQGNYTVSILSIAGNTNAYHPTVTSKTFSSTGSNPTNTPIVTATPTTRPPATPTPGVSTPTPTRLPTPTAIATTNTPTPTLASGGTKTCYQVCSYSYECAATAPYCFRPTGSSFSYCSTSSTTLTCTSTTPSATPTPTLPRSITPTFTPTPTRFITPTPMNTVDVCTQYLGNNYTCRLQSECVSLGGSPTGYSCGVGFYCCYGK
jgi:subtilisin family serine protease